MSDAGPVIAVEGLVKRFAVYRRPRDLLIELVTQRRLHEEFTALDDVSFEVHPGEVLGVMGRNGAGKSTLLKIVAGTQEPSSGRVAVRGPVAAILELGTGFHPHYTGRENVIMGGMCLGMSERAIRARLDEVVAFAELEEFIDQPLRIYSTGMQSRLAFATAMAVDPRVLIVDEALSVGDARFQLKCHDRFRAFREEGRTILLVSHSSEQITAVCDRAILLERGRLVADGSAAEVTRTYHKMLFGGGEGAAARVEEGDADGAGEGRPQGTRMGSGGVGVDRFELLDAEGFRVRRLQPGRRYRVRFEAEARGAFDDLVAGFLVRDRTGLVMFGLDTAMERDRRFSLAAGERVALEMEFTCNLGPGEYFLSFGVAHHDGRKLDYLYDALDFSAERAAGVYHASRCHLDAALRVLRADEVPSPARARDAPE